MSNNLKKNFSFLSFFKNKKKNKDLPLHEPSFNFKELVEMRDCILKKNVSTSGRLTKLFENSIAKQVKSKYVIATNSGTSSLHLALIAMGVEKNDEVLMPSLNYIASANACLYVGADPHFIDIEKKTLGVDADKLKQYLNEISTFKNGHCINKRTKKRIKAIICLHTFGHPCEVDKLKFVAKKFKLSLIEDAAEGLGSYYKKKHVGTFGDIGILSFNGNKIITTGGGGAILTDNELLAKKIFNFATINKKKHNWKYEYDHIGYNYRMPSLNAALGLAQIKKLNSHVKKKRTLFKRYKKIFSQNTNFELFEEPKNSKSNYWLQTILLNKKYRKYKDQILEASNRDGIKIRPVWRPIHKSKHLKNFNKMDLKNTLELENRIINLPSSPEILEILR